MSNDIKILGLSGKKQSGKNTSANYLIGVFLKALHVVEDFQLTTDGELGVTDIFGDKKYAGIFDPYSTHPEFVQFAEENIWPFIKWYSYADFLKQHVCIDVLGLRYEQCYGTDAEKNTETHLKWEDMPEVITDFNGEAYSNWEKEIVKGRLGKYYKKSIDGFVFHAPGPMTGREVMQFVGTEVFRKMYNNVWVDATIRQIKKDRPGMAVITDVRFANEVDGILKQELMSDTPCGGKVVRFLRDPYEGQDQHASETALDDYDFEGNPNCIVIDNKTMTIPEQNKALHDVLAANSWIPHHIPDEVLAEVTPK